MAGLTDAIFLGYPAPRICALLIKRLSAIKPSEEVRFFHIHMLKRILRANQLPRKGWVRNVLSTLRMLPVGLNCQHLSDYTPDPTLGNHLDLVFTVKHQQQRALNRLLLGRLRDGQSMRTLGGRTPRSYRDGLLVQHALRNGIVQQMQIKEPFGLDQHGPRLAVAAGNEVRIYDTDTEVNHVYRNPWFAQLHSVYFSADGERLLVVSTGFDTVLEFDVSRRELTFAWNAWENGFDTSPAGIRIRRGSASISSKRPRTICVNDPLAWNGFGLPTGLTATHLNNARYSGPDSILTTLFHQGRAIMVDRVSGSAREVLGGLLNPHGFEPGWKDEYVVTDTRRGQVIFFDEQLRVKFVLVIDGCEPSESRKGLDEWLQNVLHLDAGLYAAIDIHRCCIWLFEPVSQRYRKIDISPDWAVQNVIGVDPLQIKALRHRLDDFPRTEHEVRDPLGVMATPALPQRHKRSWRRKR